MFQVVYFPSLGCCGIHRLDNESDLNYRLIYTSMYEDVGEPHATYEAAAEASAEFESELTEFLPI